jgi:hypothetical protein
MLAQIVVEIPARDSAAEGVAVGWLGWWWWWWLQVAVGVAVGTAAAAAAVEVCCGPGVFTPQINLPLDALGWGGGRVKQLTDSVRAHAINKNK